MSIARRVIGGLLAGVVIAGLGGCATNGGGTTVPSGAGAKFRDPIVRASLRETAIARLEAAAVASDPMLRANALEGLGLAPSRLEPLLAGGLADANPGVRSVAAVMAGRLGANALVPDIRRLLDDPSPQVRASAILSLRRLGAEVDPTPLATMLLRDSSMLVRSQAAFVLGEMGNPSGLRLLRAGAKASVPRAGVAELRLFQLQVAEAMVKLGDDSQITAVRAALFPSRPEELEAMALAVQILGELGDRASVDQLIFLTAFRNEEGQPYPAEIRLAVAEALAKLGRPEGVFIAREYAGNADGFVRAQAAHVFGHAGGVEHLADLERMLGDSAGVVQVSAAAGILRVLDRSESGLARGVRDW